MKTIIAAIALSIALPAVAHAALAPAPTPQAKKPCCCEDMKKKGKDCCDESQRQGNHDSHAGHDMSQPPSK